MPKTLEAFAAKHPATKGPPCLLETLTLETRAQVDQAPFPQVPHTVIADWLEAEFKVKLSASTVGRHRKKKCQCR